MRCALVGARRKNKLAIQNSTFLTGQFEVSQVYPLGGVKVASIKPL